MFLVNKSPKRLFAFGCSFTDYYWSTWAEIIALDLEIELFNFGRTGAGNQYIANTVAQADLQYNFNDDDLVIISWTNVSREDRWNNGNWITPGNIYTQGTFDENYVKKWADPLGYMLRDLCTIELTKNLLINKGCQWHMLSMCNIVDKIDQAGGMFDAQEKQSTHNEIKNLYQTTLDSIKPSFMEVLWNNDVYLNKIIPQEKKFYNWFSDGHPSPLDHLTFLNRTFSNHHWKESTINTVNHAEDKCNEFILEHAWKRKKSYALYELDHDELNRLKNITKIKQSIKPHVI